jgi:hypothetical protein
LSQNQNLVKELLGKLETIDNELTLLRDDRKSLIDEYKEKLDVKAFRAAMRIFKIRRQADNDCVIDEILDAMEGEDG